MQAIQHTAERIARQAGQAVMAYFRGDDIGAHSKATDIDIVTDADQAAEALIVRELTAAYPHHHIVGEEGGGQGAPVETATHRWYVDPVDGTTNFANGIPVFAVSLALTDADMTPLVGVVYNPASDELFSARQGGGATLNGVPLEVSTTDDLKASVLASGFPYDKAIDPDNNNVAEWGRFLVQTRGLRRMGAAALDCCYVAAGRFDGYWEQKVKPWDVLAGLLCVTEAGGTVSDYAGHSGPGWIQGGRVVVSNGHLHPAMLTILSQASSS